MSTKIRAVTDGHFCIKYSCSVDADFYRLVASGVICTMLRIFDACILN